MESPLPDADRKDDRSGRGIALETLVIASLASAAASFAASRIWGQGTLISAAATPVVVALVSEFLRHARPRRRVRPPAAIRPNVDRGTTITYYGKADRWRPRWRPALVTGLLAFAIVVALYTVSDLLTGRSITGNGQPTTFFGGSANVKKTTSPTTTVTTTTPTTTTTKTAPTTTTTKTAPTAPPTSTTTKTAPTTTTTGATSTPNTTTPTSANGTTTPTTTTTAPTATTQPTPVP